jgi:hypothetical protein
MAAIPTRVAEPKPRTRPLSSIHARRRLAAALVIAIALLATAAIWLSSHPNAVVTPMGVTPTAAQILAAQR